MSELDRELSLIRSEIQQLELRDREFVIETRRLRKTHRMTKIVFAVEHVVSTVLAVGVTILFFGYALHGGDDQGEWSSTVRLGIFDSTWLSLLAALALATTVWKSCSYYIDVSAQNERELGRRIDAIGALAEETAKPWRHLRSVLDDEFLLEQHLNKKGNKSAVEELRSRRPGYEDPPTRQARRERRWKRWEEEYD